MEVWTIIKWVIGLVIFGFILHLARTIAPASVQPALGILDTIYFAMVAILTILIDLIISLLTFVKGLIPR